MALTFSRDTKLFVTVSSLVFEIPILDGFSFSQAQNIQDITLNEAASSPGVSRRGREALVNSINPAEFSFSTYIRPFKSAGSGGSAADNATEHHLVDDVLWSLLLNADDSTFAGSDGSSAAAADQPGWAFGGAASTLTPSSNDVTLNTCTLTFLVGDQSYVISDCVMNECTIDFDIDGIATANWSGFGTTIADGSAAGTVTCNEGIFAQNNFIRNRLSQVKLTGLSSDPTTVNYSITLIGGSLTISNNITYLTPEQLGKVNTPLGHVTGTRSVTGNLNCYHNTASNGSADLLEDILEDIGTATSAGNATNSHSLDIFIGGGSGTDPSTPGMIIRMGRVHLEIPTLTADDVMTVDITFHALPADLDSSDEITAIIVEGATPA